MIGQIVSQCGREDAQSAEIQIDRPVDIPVDEFDAVLANDPHQPAQRGEIEGVQIEPRNLQSRRVVHRQRL